MKIKMADSIQVFMCDVCSSVHIGMYRKGKMFAEAIPFDAKALARELNDAVAISEAMQIAPDRSKH